MNNLHIRLSKVNDEAATGTTEIASLDLAKFNIPVELEEGLLRAHAAEYGHLAVETQRQAHRCIRKLLKYLCEAKPQLALPLDRDLPIEFHRWLGRSGLAGSTAQSIQAIVLTILRWCHRNLPSLLDKQTSFAVPSFGRQEPERRVKLDKDQTMMILGACYERISQIENRLLKGRRLLDGHFENEEERNLSKTIEEMLALGGGKIPAQQTLLRARGAHRRMATAGGHRKLRQLLSLGTADILPFYLAVVIQTGGNPMAVLKLKVDCLRAHPLREDLECIDWDKPRSKSEQRVDFPKKKKWSAPNIVRKLLFLNESLRRDAPPPQAELAFIAASVHGSKPRVPSVQSLHNHLEDFLKAHGFPNFDFKDWRTYAAKAHRVAGGSIESARRRLNHKSSKTTEGYAGVDEFRLQLDERIVHFQGQLISRSSQSAVDESDAVDKVPSVNAPTIFGFNCRDPFGGLDGVSARGSRCLNFTRCSTCPGALVPVDDPRVVAALLGAKEALESAKGRAMANGWWPRYKALYDDSLEILVRSILPAVPPSVLAVARTQIKAHQVPHLE